MIISHKYKFIYIKTRKTASTSVELALAQLLGDEDVITPVVAEDEELRRTIGGKGPQNYLEPWNKYSFKSIVKFNILKKSRKPLFYNHIPAQKVKEIIGDQMWNSYYKFSFERNPWDKVVSLYYYLCKSEPRPTIYEFLKSPKSLAALNYELYTIDNEIAMDYIGRYENLEQDFNFVCEHLKLPTIPSLPKAKSEFRKNKAHYSQILSEQEKNLIADIFSKEIKYFNYQF